MSLPIIQDAKFLYEEANKSSEAIRELERNSIALFLSIYAAFGYVYLKTIERIIIAERNAFFWLMLCLLLICVVTSTLGARLFVLAILRRELKYPPSLTHMANTAASLERIQASAIGLDLPAEFNVVLCRELISVIDANEKVFLSKANRLLLARQVMIGNTIFLLLLAVVFVLQGGKL